MAILAEKKGFMLIWKIENFSMCPHMKGQCHQSPVFIVDLLNQTEWQFDLYPRGISNDSFLSLGLQKTEDKTSSVDMYFGSSYELISSDEKSYGDTLISVDALEDGHYISDEFIKLSELFENKDTLIPNDTLTVRCLLWRCSENATEGFENVINDRERGENVLVNYGFTWTKCFVRTQISMNKTVLLWPLKRFDMLYQTKQLQQLASTENKDFYLLFSVTENGYIDVIVQRNGKGEQAFIQCKISVLDQSEAIQYSSVVYEKLFHLDDLEVSWKFPFSSKICSADNYLKCEFSFSLHGPQSQKFKQTYIGISGLGEQLLQFYRQGRFCDVILNVGERNFSAHKLILCARSAVFSAMFENEMKEKKSGTVDITDLSPATVDLMLTYMYTEELVDLSVDDTIELYSAAAKYEFSSLKRTCVAFLKDFLTPSNVFEISILAAMHQDETLKEATMNCIIANKNEMFNSQQWKDFMKQNSTVAADIMHYCITKGMKQNKTE